MLLRPRRADLGFSLDTHCFTLILSQKVSAPQGRHSQAREASWDAGTRVRRPNQEFARVVSSRVLTITRIDANEHPVRAPDGGAASARRNEPIRRGPRTIASRQQRKRHQADPDVMV